VTPDWSCHHFIEALLKPFDKSDNEVPDTRGYAERAGDAFLDVLKQAANCPDLPTHNGVRTEVAFTISLDALERATDDTILPGHTSYLTAREARRIACDCHAFAAVMSGTSQPLDVAVPAYVVPAHIRRALVLRDRGCVFPSCDRPASVCDAHHIQPHLQGGPSRVGGGISPAAAHRTVRDTRASHGSCCPPRRACTESPMSEQLRIGSGDVQQDCPAFLPTSAQSFIFAAKPRREHSIDRKSQEPDQFGAIEAPIVVDPSGYDRVDPSHQILQLQVAAIT